MGGKSEVLILCALAARRAKTQAWVLLAAFLSVLAASTALTTIAAFASATREEAVVRAVDEASPAQLRIEIDNGAGNIDPVAATTALTADVHNYLPQISAETDSVFYSQTASSGPGSTPSDKLAAGTQLTFWASDQLPDHAKIIEGHKPSAASATGGGQIQVDISQSTASRYHLAVGSSYEFTSVAGSGTFTVAGIYRPASDAYNTFAQSGLADSLALYVAPEAFNGGIIGLGTCKYLIVPDVSQLSGSNVSAVSSSLHALMNVLAADAKLGSATTAITGLPSLLAGVVQELAVARTAIAIPCVLLLAVAGGALAFTARLLAAGRRTGTVLMLARGATPRQLAGCGAIEAAVLCALAQVPAILLAGPLAGLVSAGGSVPVSAFAVWAAAAGSWLAATAILAIYAGMRPAGGERTRGAVVGLGAEAALVLLGALSLWELTAHGPAEAALGLVDPVVVFAPSIAVLACAVLSLRVIPWTGKAIELLARRARSWAAPYGAWSAARAGRAAGGPVVLLVMAIGTVILADSFLTAAARSAVDQADYSVGTDVRVTGVTEQPLSQADSVGNLTYLAGAAQISRLSGAIGADSSEGTTQILIADPAQLAAAGELRTDLGPGGISGITSPLLKAETSGQIATEPGLALPGRPKSVTVGLTLTGSAADTGGSLELTFQGAVGEAESIYLPVAAGSGQQQIGVELDKLVGDGADAAWPLRLTRLNLLLNRTIAGAAQPGLRLDSVQADGSPVALPADQHWAITAGADSGTTVVSAIASPDAAPTAIGAVATPGFLAASGKHIGDTAVIVVEGRTIPVRIYGEANAIPTIGPSGDGLLLDQADADASGPASSTVLVGDLEWWLKAEPGHIDALAAEAAKAQPGTTVIDRLAVRTDYADDPVRAGPAGALRIAAVAVALLALIGFATRLASEIRYRAREIAIARALGLDPGRVGLAFAVQQAFEAAVAVCAGCLIGGALAERIVPLTIVARDGSPAVPVPDTTSPWPAILGGAGIAVLCVLAAGCFVWYAASALSISSLLRTESEASR